MSAREELLRRGPFDPETVQCPYPYFAALRDAAPVHKPEGANWYVVSRYEDAQYVAMHPELFSSTLVAFVMKTSGATQQVLEMPEDAPRPADVLAIVDPPAHTRHRKLVNPAFNVRRVATLEPAVRAAAGELAAAMVRAGRAEAMAEFAVPLPLGIIADLLGLPRADVPRLKEWSDAGVAVLSGLTEPEEFGPLVGKILEYQRYLAGKFAEAKAAPGENVIGDMVRATRAEGEERLTDDEAISIVFQLLIAGNESTTSLIGSALNLLLEHPAEQARLRRDPAGIPDFLEETLRLESPFQGHFRMAKVDAEVGGVKIPAGARILVNWASANRDERRFAEPDACKADRSDLREHLGFGWGIHRCVGAPLARLEARVALEELLGRTRELRLAPGAEVRRVPSVFVRRIAALPVELVA